jgi:hypothetical protein
MLVAIFVSPLLSPLFRLICDRFWQAYLSAKENGVCAPRSVSSFLHSVDRRHGLKLTQLREPAK